MGDREEAYQTLVSYRTGDVWAPKLDTTEALRLALTTPWAAEAISRAAAGLPAWLSERPLNAADRS